MSLIVLILIIFSLYLTLLCTSTFSEDVIKIYLFLDNFMRPS